MGNSATFLVILKSPNTLNLVHNVRKSDERGKTQNLIENEKLPPSAIPSPGLLPGRNLKLSKGVWLASFPILSFWAKVSWPSRTEAEVGLGGIKVEGGDVAGTEKTRKTNPVVSAFMLSGLSPVPWWLWYPPVFLVGRLLCPQPLWMLLDLQLLFAEGCLPLQVTILDKPWADPMPLLVHCGPHLIQWNIHGFLARTNSGSAGCLL